MSLELKPVILDQPQINEFYENYGEETIVIDENMWISICQSKRLLQETLYQNQ